MDYIEEPRVLPRSLDTPKSIVNFGKAYGECVCWSISMYGNDVFISSEDGSSFVIRKPEDLFNAVSKYDSIFTYSPDNILDLLLKTFPEECVARLDDTPRSFEYGEYKIKQYFSTRLDIKKGRNSINIYDISKMTTEALITTQLVRVWLSKFNELSSLLGQELDVSSPSACASSLFKKYINNPNKEFLRLNSLSYDAISIINSSIHNTWMEPLGLGSISNVENVDYIKAHLNLLGEVPSIYDHKTMVVENPRYDPEASMGFYFIEVNVPKQRFGLIPFRSERSELAPYGKFSCYVAKPMMDKIIELGFEYKIIKAVQFIPIGDIEYPFIHYSKFVGGLIDSMSDNFKPLDLKFMLYKSIIGFMQHIHLSDSQPDIIESEDDINFKASSLFNLALASTVYSKLNCSIYDLLSSSERSLYRRHDAVTRVVSCKDKLGDRFKVKNSGRMFILTPIMHDNPGSTTLRDIANNCRDNKDLLVIYTQVPASRKSLYYDPERFGTKVDLFRKITPCINNRRCNYDRFRIGDLLDGFKPSIGMVNVADIRSIKIETEDGSTSPLDLKGVEIHATKKRR